MSTRRPECPEHVIGFLDGGLAAAATRSDLVESTERVSPERAATLARDAHAVLLDVRTPAERAASAIAGSVHMPLGQLAQRQSEIPAERPVIVFCAGGYRSSIAASLLRRSGVSGVQEIAGGITAWQTAGLPA